MKQKTNTSSRDAAAGNQDSDSREKILKAALAEFAEHGAAGARVERIARQAGVNKALLYYYYSSKELLYMETVRSALGDFVGDLKGALEGADDLDSSLNSLTEFYRTVFLTRSEVPRLLMRELANPDSEVVKFAAECLVASGAPAHLREVLIAGQRAGEIREVDIRQTIASFIAMQFGYFFLSPMIDRALNVESREQFLTDRKEAVVDLLLNGVKAT